MRPDAALAFLALLADWEVTADNEAIIAREMARSGVADVSRWPLLIASDYEDTVLMCGGYVLQETRAGLEAARDCRSRISCDTPAAMASDLLEHLAVTRHFPGPLAALNEQFRGMRERRLTVVMDAAGLDPGTPVVLRGVTWGRVVDETVIVQLPGKCLVAVPVADLELSPRADR